MRWFWQRKSDGDGEVTSLETAEAKMKVAELEERAEAVVEARKDWAADPWTARVLSTIRNPGPSP